MPTPTPSPEPRRDAEPASTVPADLLSRVRVAAPCTASWDAMPGGERVRSCEKCAHKVYNLSAMTADDAARLVARAEGKDAERVCVRFYRRSDGTMLTQDCPVGARALRQRAARRASVAFAAMGAVFGMGSLAGKPRDEQPPVFQWVLNAIDPPTPSPALPIAPDERMMRTTGMVALPMASDLPPSPPPAPEATMGEPVARMGDVSVVLTTGQARVAAPTSSFAGGPEPAPPPADKSFLQGASDNGDAIRPAATETRPDPFAPQPGIMGKVRIAPQTHATHQEK